MKRLATKRHDGNACTLGNHPEVQARLEEIMPYSLLTATGPGYSTLASVGKLLNMPVQNG
jgi:hypothetical protein